MDKDPLQNIHDDYLVSVGVMVDLELSENAGGHVKCWQRFAEAAACLGAAGGVDLTVYFLGEAAATIALGEHVRYRLVPPRRSTRNLGLNGLPAHTDLAQRNPAAEASLGAHDVFHITGPFALSLAALEAARRKGVPVAASVHTDNPQLTRYYMPQIVSRLLGDTPGLAALIHRFGLPKLAARIMARRVAHGLRRANHLFYVNCSQHDYFNDQFPAVAHSHLRHGIDRERFHPARRDRASLALRFGLPPETPILAFAGRIDGSKNADLVVAISEHLWSWGIDHRLLMLGDGALRQGLQQRLGARGVLPGAIPQHDLGWIFASADTFVFPSETETAGKVALEAMACGLPLVLMAGTAPSEVLGKVGGGGVLVRGRDPAVWARALATILTDRAVLSHARDAARRAGALLPSWQEVLEQDLLPVWRELAGRDRAARAS